MAKESLAPKDKKAAAFIRRERRRRGWSPERMGEAIGVSGNTIRFIELGGVPYENTQRAVADFFDKESGEDIWRKARIDYLHAARAREKAAA